MLAEQISSAISQLQTLNRPSIAVRVTGAREIAFHNLKTQSQSPAYPPPAQEEAFSQSESLSAPMKVDVDVAYFDKLKLDYSRKLHRSG